MGVRGPRPATCLGYFGRRGIAPAVLCYAASQNVAHELRTSEKSLLVLILLEDLGCHCRATSEYKFDASRSRTADRGPRFADRRPRAPVTAPSASAPTRSDTAPGCCGP